MITDINELTPVEDKGGIYFKREDKFTCISHLFTGTKARVAAILAKGQTGLTTIHTIEYPQGPLVASTAKSAGIPCRIHTIEKAAREMPRNPHGATVVIHKSKEYMDRAVQADSKLTGFFMMAVNMDCTEAQESIEAQCANIPDDTCQILVNANDEGSVARAILQGMKVHGKKGIIIVHGKNTNGIAAHFRLFGPEEWFSYVHIQEEAPTPMEKDLVWVGNYF